jgi:hypothetical protein
MMKAKPALILPPCDKCTQSGPGLGGDMDRSDASALADLQMHWDEAYVIGLDGDIWSARYRKSADEFRAHTCTELRELIRSDYAYRQKVDVAAHAPDDDDVDTDEADKTEPDASDGNGVDLARISGERMSL